MSGRTSVRVLVCAAAAAGALFPATAAATTYTVTPGTAAQVTNADCNWFEAVRAANDDVPYDACPAGTGDDIVQFGAGEYTLPTVALPAGDATPADSTTLRAATGAAVTLRQTGTAGAVVTTSGNNGGVAIENLTITGANRAGSVVGGGISAAGGGPLTLSGVLITGNSVGSGANGDGGGIGQTSAGPVTIINSTISGNSATRSGGGIEAEGSTYTIINSTITGNTASSDGTGGMGGGLHRYGAASLTVRNSIIAGNSAPGGTGPDCNSVASAVSTSNIVGDNTGCAYPAGSGDQIGVNPLLDPLVSNGGSTRTHALLTGSPAIDRATFTCPATDQRGLPRPSLSGCDIGAFELQGPPAKKKKCKRPKKKGKGKAGAAAKKKGCKKKRKKGK